MAPSEQGPSSYSFGSHPTTVSSMSLKRQLETLKGERVFSNGTSRAKGIKQDEPARPRWARPELAGSRCPCHTPCWVFLLQSQPSRLEPQVFGQEHGEDAAQVVHRRGVQIGLRVISRVPDRGEGRGDEVEHWDPCGTERRLRPSPAPPQKITVPWRLKNSEQSL